MRTPTAPEWLPFSEVRVQAERRVPGQAIKVIRSWDQLELSSLSATARCSVFQSIGKDVDADTIDGFLTADQCPAGLSALNAFPTFSIHCIQSTGSSQHSCPLLCARDCVGYSTDGNKQDTRSKSLPAGMKDLDCHTTTV